MSIELHPSNCQWRHHACHGPWKLHGFINYTIHSYKLRRYLYYEHCVVYSNSNHFHHGNSFCSLWLPTYSSKQKCCLLRKSAFGALFKEVNHIAYQVRKCITSYWAPIHVLIYKIYKCSKWSSTFFNLKWQRLFWFQYIFKYALFGLRIWILIKIAIVEGFIQCAYFSHFWASYKGLTLAIFGVDPVGISA